MQYSNKIILIAWSPDDAGVHVCFTSLITLLYPTMRPFLADTNKQPKMIYAASKEALKRSLEGFAYELQANDSDDLEHSSILNAVLAKMNA